MKLPDFIKKGNTVLVENNYRVNIANTANEAKKIFNKENIDLVFSDVVLPDITGLDLVNELKSIKPDIKILLTSGYTDTKSQWALIQAKGIPFLQKPYSFMNLLKMLKDILQNEE